MSPQREPAAPPVLEGYAYQRLLGSGGFADVYLYERDLPRMPVAVKVLVATDLGEEDQRRFTDEANIMARFYSHPYIVGILNAAVASDGRPYIVMQFYPKDNLAVRSRRKPLSVTETLRVGIQIASAVETAHRAGVVHRDIKPANILTSEFGDPGLTDFGISATTAGGQESDGLSIPWSPPEAFDYDIDLDARSDVYSLGATIFTFLTGRSPFEVPGRANSQLDLMGRIERSPVPTSGRGDVPTSLTRMLSQSMSKHAELRQQSALALARDLQAVEQELHLKMTPIVLPDDSDSLAEAEESEDGETRGRMPVRIDAQVETPRLPPRSPNRPVVDRPSLIDAIPADPRVAFSGQSHLDRTGKRARVDIGKNVQSGAEVRDRSVPGTASPGAVQDGTRKRVQSIRDVEEAVEQVPSEQRRSRTGTVVGLVLLGAVAAIVTIVLLSSSPTRPPTATSTVPPPTALVAVVPVPTRVTAVKGVGKITITWNNPDEQSGDFFKVKEASPSGATASPTVTATSLVVTNPEFLSGKFCATIQLVRKNGQASTPSTSVCTT